MKYLLGWTILALAAMAAEEPWLVSVKMVPPTAYEAAAKVTRNGVFADRKIYWNDDVTGQFLVMFLGQETAGKSVALELLDGTGTAVKQAELPTLTEPKAALLLAVNRLPVGSYVLRATLPGEPAVTAEVAFAREDRQAAAIPFPAEGVRLELQEQSILEDTSWPVCIGVPFPQGTVTEVGTLRLEEDGQPVAAEIRAINTWHPAAPGVAASVRWAHVVFQAKYRGGKPAAYRLRAGGGQPVTPAAEMSVEETAETITVTTAKTRWLVNRRSFGGIEGAWYDRDGDGEFTQFEQLVLPRGDEARGPYLVDSRDRRFEAAKDTAPSVAVETRGPEEVTIAATGWYVNPELSDLAGQRLCRFVTRLVFRAGRPEVQVHQRTIITYDTNTYRLLDVGFALPIQEAERVALGVDGERLESELPRGKVPLYLHQYRWDRARIVNLPKAGPNPGQTIYETREGARADGWASLAFGEEDPNAIEDDRPTVSVLVREMPERFPRELSFTRTAVTVHAWPAHGTNTFSQDELYHENEIYKLRFFHQGRLLDLRFPAEADTALRELREKTAWDPEDMVGTAVNGNGQGVVLNSEFCIRLHPAAEAAGPRARLYQMDPAGRSDPEWNAATRVEGPVAARDRGAFAAMEEEIDTAYPAYLRTVVDRGAEYGSFIYANTHNKAKPEENSAYLHRVWQAAHYRQVWEPWFLFFRGNSFELVKWARAYSDHFMDVDTCNWADEANGRIKWHVAGSMYHAKGFTPWGTKAFGQVATDSYAGHQGHWINPTAFLIRYLLEGHARSRDLGELWVDALLSHRVWAGASREIGNTSNEVFQYYRFTLNPDLLPVMADQTDGMLKPAFKDWPAPYHHPWFNPFWFVHWYELSRDPRVMARIEEYCRDPQYGGSATMHALMAEEAGKPEWLPRYLGTFSAMPYEVYNNPGDPLDGFRGHFISDPYTRRQQWPFWLHAAKRGGMAGLSLEAATSYYPSSSAHDWFIESERPAVEVLALEETDRDWRYRLEDTSDAGPMSMRVFDPAGKLLIDKSLRTEAEGRKIRYWKDDIVVLPVKADGVTGVYRIDIRTHQVHFAAPYTDLAVEGSRLQPQRGYQCYGLDHYLAVTAPVTLTYRAIAFRTSVTPNYLAIVDADGKTVLETTLMFGSRREQAEVTLDPAVNRPPYRVRALGIGSLTWDGETPWIILAGSAEAATKLSAALAR